MSLIETETCRPDRREDDSRVVPTSPENNEVYFLRTCGTSDKACRRNSHTIKATKKQPAQPAVFLLVYSNVITDSASVAVVWSLSRKFALRSSRVD